MDDIQELEARGLEEDPRSVSSPESTKPFQTLDNWVEFHLASVQSLPAQPTDDFDPKNSVASMCKNGRAFAPHLHVPVDHAENLLFAVHLLQTQPLVLAILLLVDGDDVWIVHVQMVAKGEHKSKSTSILPLQISDSFDIQAGSLSSLGGWMPWMILLRLGVGKGCVGERSNCVRIDAVELLDQLVPSPARQARCVVEREGMENVAFVSVQPDGELRGIQMAAFRCTEEDEYPSLSHLAPGIHSHPKT
ncbi:hypothetical protein SELMODRAFT_417734 [Selaginella moellendorffii]|uniref:Uncharacterized protein n=1 Tax=Selaginella moellendorffii TaxID=88036 RepID=D8S3F6_SELML|nr:hypothetical protein SELMODRAFT_417734 [Selaginella moellendorffii]